MDSGGSVACDSALVFAQKFGQIVWSCNIHCVVKGKVVVDLSLASGAA